MNTLMNAIWNAIMYALMNAHFESPYEHPNEHRERILMNICECPYERPFGSSLYFALLDRPHESLLWVVPINRPFLDRTHESPLRIVWI